jgi:DNA-binding NarL/FixJ family response regulator
MTEPPADQLTDRELEVLRLLGRGLSNRLIARKLDISEKTVKNHLSNIYFKIGATHRTQAALYARDAGLIEARGEAGQQPPVAGRPAPLVPVPDGGASVGLALTTRERGILRMLARGLSNRLIARELGISEKTVKNHLSNIYFKIGATHRTQAALYAQRTGLAS